MTINYYGNIVDIKFDNTKNQRFSFIITKFGQIPDPILVKGDDGKEYNVIQIGGRQWHFLIFRIQIFTI